MPRSPAQRRAQRGCCTGNEDDGGDDDNDNDDDEDDEDDDGKIHLLPTLTKNHSHLGEKLSEGSQPDPNERPWNCSRSCPGCGRKHKSRVSVVALQFGC